MGYGSIYEWDFFLCFSKGELIECLVWENGMGELDVLEGYGIVVLIIFGNCLGES